MGSTQAVRLAAQAPAPMLQQPTTATTEPPATVRQTPPPQPLKVGTTHAAPTGLRHLGSYAYTRTPKESDPNAPIFELFMDDAKHYFVHEGDGYLVVDRFAFIAAPEGQLRTSFGAF